MALKKKKGDVRFCFYNKIRQGIRNEFRQMPRLTSWGLDLISTERQHQIRIQSRHLAHHKKTVFLSINFMEYDLLGISSQTVISNGAIIKNFSLIAKLLFTL